MAEGPVTPEELAAWQAFLGRSETRRQTLDPESLRRYAVAVGGSPEVETRAPPLAHWAWFLEAAPNDRLGPDGHPLRGQGILPPVRLERRMFAAATMSFAGPLELGAEAELTLSLAEVRHRSGRSGDLVFVEVDRVLTQGGAERVRERQTIVYRAAGERTAPVEPREAPEPTEATRWTPDPVELFRFSAATFNSHRIHYDLPYARDVEGYPGLVVHGPLTAARLFGYAASRIGPVARFSFRAQAPLFAGQPILLAPGEGPGEVRAIRCDGAVAMAAEAAGANQL
jgi:3-methylfumaryl-CoA hydratase